ncbi:hypothetical protein EDEG_02374 [Edhazardia aedis USNM 41457]|uniref:Transmembrane protein n=1 Tax=Edhazardia aedis (strain USNM 41457) TaxID=1003232 RepID=J9DKZ8_EDHAE|nr:hypothetical protein EDEG_02374 [Edhazardia aedis USNM 41457]|eukprot:EJW03270.1 hypothetical protein EDEG_02374 [Edhazardia aedis USNM 41457]
MKFLFIFVVNSTPQIQQSKFVFKFMPFLDCYFLLPNSVFIQDNLSLCSNITQQRQRQSKYRREETVATKFTSFIYINTYKHIWLLNTILPVTPPLYAFMFFFNAPNILIVSLWQFCAFELQIFALFFIFSYFF